jgi:hypothetical protein
MAIVAYLISAFTHEALGHGLASLIVNAPIKHVTSLDLVSDLSHLTPWGARFVDAAGCAAQFIVAGVVYVIYRRTPQRVETHAIFSGSSTFSMSSFPLAI